MRRKKWIKFYLAKFYPGKFQCKSSNSGKFTANVDDFNKFHHSSLVKYAIRINSVTWIQIMNDGNFYCVKDLNPSKFNPE